MIINGGWFNIFLLFNVILVSGQLLQSSPELLCTMDDQCNHIYGNFSSCTRGKCVCFTAADMKNVTQCKYQSKGHKVTVLGFTCEIDKNCKPENSVCDEETKKCVCPEEFSIESADKRKCFKPLNSTDDTCQDVMQCVSVMENTECQDGKCVCSDKYNDFNGTCIAKSSLNAGCFNEGNCKHIAFSECNSRFCKCLDGYLAKLDGSMCLPIADKLGEICAEHQQCEFNLGKGSQCVDKMCGCKEEFVGNENKTYCDVVPYVGKECLSDEHCLLPAFTRAPETMVCFSGMCRCKLDHYQKDLKCFKNESTRSLCNLQLLLGMLLYYLFNL